MSGNSAKREDVQKIILALLISRKHAIPLFRLNEDYQEQEGECIPWKEFGYLSLYDYLRSMPKYIHVQNINGIFYAHGIASDKSKHISSLVARQKEELKKTVHTNRIYKSNPYYPRTQDPRVYIPANVLSDIICMVKKNPNGINMDYILEKVREKIPHINISRMDIEEQLKNLSHQLFVRGTLVFPFESKIKFKTNQRVSPKILPKVEVNSYSQHNSALSRYTVSGDSDSDTELNINDFDIFASENVSSSDNQNNRNMASKKKEPISTFIQEPIFKCHNQDDQFNDTLMYSVKGNEHNCPENNVTLQRPREEMYEDDISYINDTSVNILISDRIKFRLEKLIQKYPNGIWCAELPEKYLQEYNICLNYIELGFNSVRDFVSYLPEIFRCKQPQPSGDFILYDANSESTDAKQKDKSTDTSKKLMPDGVMLIGETVGHIDVMGLANGLQPYIEVFVEEIFTPSFFWVQLRKKKKCFNKLMENLHKFYEEKSDLYKIPPVVLEKGLNCACVYNNQWHRGIIKTIKPDFQVTVMFYDYGTLKSYPPEAIYYLHRSFTYLPAQAIPCGLYNTKPCVGKQWSQSVTYEFANKTALKPLIATIVSTDAEHNSMLVTLTDTMEDEDIHINDWLVRQNLALHGQMVRIRPRNFPYRYELECKARYKTNFADLDAFKSSIIKTSKRSKFLESVKNSLKSNDLRRNSNHALFSSVSSESQSEYLSNNSENNSRNLRASTSDSTQSDEFERSEEMVPLFQKMKNETKSVDAQLNSDNSVTIKTPNNRVVGTEAQNQESSTVQTNAIDYLRKNNTVVNAQQKEQEQNGLPLPKKFFINAVNLSINSQSYNPDYDTLPDDNITTNNATSKSILKHKNKINLKNIETGVQETILSVLRSGHTDNESTVDTSKNTIQIRYTVRSNNQPNNVHDNETTASDVCCTINVEDNHKLNEESIESFKIPNEQCIPTNITLVINDTDRSNDNSTTPKNERMYRLRLLKILRKVCNMLDDNVKLDSNDQLFNSQNSSNNIDEAKTDLLSDVSEINIDKETSVTISNADINKNDLATVDCQLQLDFKNEEKCFEYVESHESIFEDASKEAIPMFADNDLESNNSDWDIVGEFHDLLGHNFPSFFGNHFLTGRGNTGVQITEINDNK